MIYDTMQANSELYTGTLNAAFYDLVQRMRDNTKHKGTVNPNHLHNVIFQQWEQFQGYGQQDSHELLRLLIDQLAEECSDEAHLVKRLFSGRLASLVVCNACYNVFFYSFTLFDRLPLQVRSSWIYHCRFLPRTLLR